MPELSGVLTAYLVEEKEKLAKLHSHLLLKLGVTLKEAETAVEYDLVNIVSSRSCMDV